MDKREVVRKFIDRFAGGQPFDDSEDIFETGLVNSLFLMQLVLFLENQFLIVVKNQDLDIANFKDVNSIVSYIEANMRS